MKEYDDYSLSPLGYGLSNCFTFRPTLDVHFMPASPVYSTILSSNPSLNPSLANPTTTGNTERNGQNGKIMDANQSPHSNWNITGNQQHFLLKAWIKLTLLDANDEEMRKQRKDSGTERINKIKILNVLVVAC